MRRNTLYQILIAAILTVIPLINVKAYYDAKSLIETTDASDSQEVIEKKSYIIGVTKFAPNVEVSALTAAMAGVRYNMITGRDDVAAYTYNGVWITYDESKKSSFVPDNKVQELKNMPIYYKSDGKKFEEKIITIAYDIPTGVSWTTDNGKDSAVSKVDGGLKVPASVKKITLSNGTVLNVEKGEVTSVLEEVAFRVDNTVVLTSLETVGENYVFPKTPTKNGYDFLGWYKNGEQITGNSKVEDTNEVNAKWSFLAFFNPDNGSEPIQITQMMNENYIMPETAPTKTGYSFVSWKKDTTTITSEVIAYDNGEIKAEWLANKYNIEYISNTGIGTMEPTENIEYDEQVNLPPNAFTKEGYTFSRWTLNQEGTGNSYSDGDAVKNLTANDNDTIRLYAQWEANNYEVEFNANDGSDTKTTQAMVYDNDAVELNSNTFVRTGYSFAGWNTNPEGTGTDYIENQEVRNLTSENNGKISLYAQWTPITYNLTYNLNNGAFEDTDSHPDSINFDEMLIVNAPSKVITITGYANDTGATIGEATINPLTFNGWNITNMDEANHTYGNNITTDNSLTNITETDYKNLRKDNLEPVTFTATWTSEVVFPTVTKTGYTCGWSSNPLGSIEYNSGESYVVGEDSETSIAVYAICTPNSYSVVYDTNKPEESLEEVSGVMENSQFTYDNDEVLRTNTYTLTGYTFVGWNTSADGSGTSYQNEESVSNLITDGSITLFAQWAQD